jgi:hypothetical protein
VFHDEASADVVYLLLTALGITTHFPANSARRLPRAPIKIFQKIVLLKLALRISEISGQHKSLRLGKAY